MFLHCDPPCRDRDLIILYNNPHDQPKTVGVALAKPADLYDRVEGRYVARGAQPALAPDRAAMLKATPRSR
jgi:hypothetical protein